MKHLVASNDGAAVGLCGFVASQLAPSCQHHNRFDVGRYAQSAYEAVCVGDAFHVDRDAVGLVVAGLQVQHLGQVDRGVGAERDHSGKANRILCCSIFDAPGHLHCLNRFAAMLRNDGEVGPGVGQICQGTGGVGVD